MPTNIPVDGNNFSIDNQGELGANQQTRLISILQALAQRLFYLSPTASAAVSGILRLAKTDWAAWRNNANNADLLLQIGNPTNNAGVANDALSFKGQLLSDQPCAIATQTVAQGPLAGPFTINFGTPSRDTDSAVTTGASWKFTCPAGKGGDYEVSVNVAWTQNTATGQATFIVLKNAGVAFQLSTAALAAAASDGRCGTMTVNLAPGDTISVTAQTSGGTLTTVPSTGGLVSFSIKRCP